MAPDTILVRDSEPAFIILQENVVLLSVERGAYFRLNRAGSQIWNMLDQPRRVGEIFDALAKTHDVDRDIMTKDVADFLDALIDRRLLRIVKPDTVA